MPFRLTAACFLVCAAAACAGWGLQPAQAANKHPDDADAVVVHVSPAGAIAPRVMKRIPSEHWNVRIKQFARPIQHTA